MIEIADQFDMEQMVTEPTRRDKILDLFFTTYSTLVNDSKVTPGISHHDGIPIIDMNIKLQVMKSKPRKIYLFKKANMEGLTEGMEELASNILACEEATAEEAWCEFRDGIFKCMDAYIPSKMISSWDNNPWITPSIKRKLRQKHRYYNHAKKTGQGRGYGEI